MTSARRYAHRGHRRVAGWLDPVAARAIHELGCWQTSRDITGGVGEIGVHHGRFFLLLHLLRAPLERSFAVDLFGMQHLNIDGSGRGDLEAFRSNVQRHAGSLDGLTVIQASSLDVHSEQITDAVGEVRMMSVDGGHTADLTENDLRLADAVLSRDGVVILDDMYSYLWPGVMTGALRFLEANEDLVPVGLLPNKTLFVRPEAAADYLEALDAVRVGFRSSREEFLGRPVVLVRGFSRGRRGIAERVYAGARRSRATARAAEALRDRVRGRS